MARVKMHDLVLILPGIMGSTLRQVRTTNPFDVWSISGQSLWKALSSLGGSLQNLQVPLHDPRSGEAPPTDLRATGLINDFHGVFGLWRIDGYDTTLRVLLDRFEMRMDTADGSVINANLITFPYDWRLSNRVSAKSLESFVADRLPRFRDATQNSQAKVILIVHSMGGLISRYWLEVLGGWRECRALITFGTPYRGAVDALNYLANGFKKAAFNKTLLDLSEVVRSCPAAYELMPSYPALKVPSSTPEGWAWAVPGECKGLPKGVNPDYALAALDFHRQIEQSIASNQQNSDYRPYPIFPVVGVQQTTLNSAILDGGVLTASELRPDWLETGLGGGDGTVPRHSAAPEDRAEDMREVFFAERHASLQGNDFVLTDLIERLTQIQARKPKPLRGGVAAPLRSIALQFDPLYVPGEAVVLRVDAQDLESLGPPQARLVARRADLPMQQRDFLKTGDHWTLDFGELPAGQYSLEVATKLGGPGAPTPIHEVIEVANKE
ncbi:hypothetical protein QTI66_38685 [Variovorax sp. J22R133]|uniref:lipase/acyltransferase domain-containing protein n=1 Tax=Variovorax brevis TaxID=3053503 RepID=UPI002575D2F2|nr:hypothetical protein [Variovorax sp. J22R133]MDM0118014.1 hypothetical protein [Variovorax sp. J22R133]